MLHSRAKNLRDLEEIAILLCWATLAKELVLNLNIVSLCVSGPPIESSDYRKYMLFKD